MAALNRAAFRRCSAAPPGRAGASLEYDDVPDSGAACLVLCPSDGSDDRSPSPARHGEALPAAICRCVLLSPLPLPLAPGAASKARRTGGNSSPASPSPALCTQVSTILPSSAIGGSAPSAGAAAVQRSPRFGSRGGCVHVGAASPAFDGGCARITGGLQVRSCNGDDGHAAPLPRGPSPCGEKSTCTLRSMAVGTCVSVGGPGGETKSFLALGKYINIPCFQRYQVTSACCCVSANTICKFARCTPRSARDVLRPCDHANSDEDIYWIFLSAVPCENAGIQRLDALSPATASDRSAPAQGNVAGQRSLLNKVRQQK
jgi:hypothetical protein